MTFLPARLPAKLAIDEGESSWLCFQGSRFAGLVWIHRTGPRPSRVKLGPSLVDHAALPAGVRALVPSWLPIIAPVDLGLDDRPLVMILLYDLDAPATHLVELPADTFDPATFSATAGGISVVHEGERVTIRARTPAFSLDLEGRAVKPAVAFGDPMVRHGRIEVGYMQRPRVALTGTIAIGGESFDVVATGAHDRHWRHSTVTGLKWLWLHLRTGDREVVAYVIRDARGGPHEDADAGRELGRAAWSLGPDAIAQPIPFELRVLAHADTARGRIPTRFAFTADGIAAELEHAVPLPYVRMRAFGDVVDFGIYEAPVRGAEGWLEIMPAQL